MRLAAADRSHALEHVGTVHPRRGDADQQLARPRPRHGSLLGNEYLGTAGLADRDGGHALGQAGHAKSPTLFDFPLAPPY